MNDFDCYARWLKIPADRRPPNYYDLLGLPALESNGERIRAASMARTAYVRRFCLGQHGAEATKLLGELAAAFACLLDPAAKAAYDARLSEEVDAAAHREADPAESPPSRVDSTAQEYDDEPPPIARRKARAGGPLRAAVQQSALRRRRAKLRARLLSAASLALVVLLYAAYRWHSLNGGQAASAKVAIAERKDYAEPNDSATASVARPSSLVRPPSPAATTHPSPPAKQRDADQAVVKRQVSSTAPSETSAEAVDDAAAPTSAPPDRDAPPERDTMQADDKQREEMDSEAEAIAATIPDFAGGTTAVVPPSRETPFEPEPSPDVAGDSAGVDDGPPADDEAPADGEPPPSDEPPEPYGAGQVAGPMDSNGQDGKFWRSRAAGRQQEWLELWFPSPVAANVLQIYLVDQPLTVDHIIIYPTTGEPIKMLPKHLPADVFRAQLFTFGVHPIETRHIKLVMHSPGAKYIEIDSVALATKSGDWFWPEAAKARTTFNQPAETDGPMFEEESLDAAGHDVRRDAPRK